MCLPVSAFQDGEINYDNVGVGRLFEVRGRGRDRTGWSNEWLRPAVATFRLIRGSSMQSNQINAHTCTM